MNKILDQLTLLVLLAVIGVVGAIFIQHWKAIVTVAGLVLFAVVCIVSVNVTPQQAIHSRGRKHKQGKPRGDPKAKPPKPNRDFLLQPKSVRRKLGKATDPWYDGPAKAIRTPRFVSDATNAWHSSKSVVYHDNTLCDGGRNIRPQYWRSGTGGRHLCKNCSRLNRRELD